MHDFSHKRAYVLSNYMFSNGYIGLTFIIIHVNYRAFNSLFLTSEPVDEVTTIHVHVHVIF